MSSRFEMPGPGQPAAVRFPEIVRTVLDNGLAVWVVPAAAAPVTAIRLVVNRGSAADPDDRPGLVSLTVDLMDEGAGALDGIALADAFGRLGTSLHAEVGADVTVFGLTVVSRHVERALALLSDVLRRPTFEAADFERIRELRVNRLRQVSRSPGPPASRAFVEAVCGSHPYGHGSLGTTRAVEAARLDELRACWARNIGPSGATLILATDRAPDAVVDAAGAVFAGWSSPAPSAAVAIPELVATTGPVVHLIDRPGAPQSELRVGHVGPARRTDAYHALLAMNGVLGSEFSSRINRNLRERRGVTYGARSAFDFRRYGGLFTAEASVDGDATALSIAEILSEMEAIRRPESVSPAELARARASLTRGYVRGFETAGHLAHAASQLATHGLSPDVFDAFVPRIEAVSEQDVLDVATRFVHPEQASVVVSGDAARWQSSLEALGRPVRLITPEF